MHRENLQFQRLFKSVENLKPSLISGSKYYMSLYKIIFVVFFIRILININEFIDQNVKTSFSLIMSGFEKMAVVLNQEKTEHWS